MTSTEDPNQPQPGPGWWISTDGKLYPPELHPSERRPNATENPPAPAAPPGNGKAGRGRRLAITAALVLVGIGSTGIGYAAGLQHGSDDDESAAQPSAPATTTPSSSSTTMPPTTLAPPVSPTGGGLAPSIVLNEVPGDATATFDRAWEAIGAEQQAVICDGVDTPQLMTLTASYAAESANFILSAAAIQSGIERNCP